MNDARSTTKTPAASNPLLTVQEVAAFLRVPVATLYGWRHKRVGPPAMKIGRHLRYRVHDVHSWLRGR